MRAGYVVATKASRSVSSTRIFGPTAFPVMQDTGQSGDGWVIEAGGMG